MTIAKKVSESISVLLGQSSTMSEAQDKLLGSAPSLDGLKQLIMKYWHSNNVTLNPISDMEWSVSNAKGEVKGFKVRKSKDRFQFVGMMDEAVMNEQTDLATVMKNHAFSDKNPLNFAMAKGKTFKDDIYITPNTKLKGDLKKMSDLKVGTVVQVIYQNTSRGYEAKEIKVHGSKNESLAYDILADSLHNDENSSDEELIDLLSEETMLPKDKIAKLIKAERPKFLRGDYIKNRLKDDYEIIKKYV